MYGHWFALHKVGESRGQRRHLLGRGRTEERPNPDLVPISATDAFVWLHRAQEEVASYRQVTRNSKKPELTIYHKVTADNVRFEDPPPRRYIYIAKNQFSTEAAANIDEIVSAHQDMIAKISRWKELGITREPGPDNTTIFVTTDPDIAKAEDFKPEPTFFYYEESEKIEVESEAGEMTEDNQASLELIPSSDHE
jgi:hypothetical protein